ncbi:MAG: hypothetical protein ACOYL5_11420 [Phototrophicaceae bacterium]|jgi:hypothetical protein
MANHILNRHQYKLSNAAEPLLEDYLTRRSEQLTAQNPLTSEDIRKEQNVVADIINDLLENPPKKNPKDRKVTVPMLKKAFAFFIKG